MSVKINPIILEGNWKKGYALDIHTIESIPIGVDPFGHTQFDTKRTEIGELLYQLKSRRDKTKTVPIAQAVYDFLRIKKLPSIAGIIPVPPSDDTRPFQPVLELAKEIGKKLSLPVLGDYVIKKIPTPQLKNVDEFREREKILRGAFKLRDKSLIGQNVLLFDDLYRSGATLSVITELLLQQGKLAEVYVLTITKTRTKR